jgi:hypothetical protein
MIIRAIIKAVLLSCRVNEFAQLSECSYEFSIAALYMSLLPQ